MAINGQGAAGVMNGSVMRRGDTGGCGVAECLEDATMCLKLRPDWFKSYYRRAVALNKMGRNVEARGMCMGGLALDKDNKELRQLRDQVVSLASVRAGGACATRSRHWLVCVLAAAAPPAPCCSFLACARHLACALS